VDSSASDKQGKLCMNLISQLGQNAQLQCVDIPVMILWGGGMRVLECNALVDISVAKV